METHPDGTLSFTTGGGCLAQAGYLLMLVAVLALGSLGIQLMDPKGDTFWMVLMGVGCAAMGLLGLALVLIRQGVVVDPAARTLTRFRKVGPWEDRQSCAAEDIYAVIISREKVRDGGPDTVYVQRVVAQLHSGAMWDVAVGADFGETRAAGQALSAALGNAPVVYR